MKELSLLERYGRLALAGYDVHHMAEVGYPPNKQMLEDTIIFSTIVWLSGWRMKKQDGFVSKHSTHILRVDNDFPHKNCPKLGVHCSIFSTPRSSTSFPEMKFDCRSLEGLASVDVELSAASKIWVESKPINIPSISHKFHAPTQLWNSFLELVSCFMMKGAGNHPA